MCNFHKTRSMQVLLRFVAVMLALVGWLAVHATAGDAQQKRYEKFADIDGARIGVLHGALFDYLVNSTLERTQLFYYSTMEDMQRALIQGELDCIVDDEPALRFLASLDSRLRVVEDSAMNCEYGFLFSESAKDFVESFNAELRKLLDDGTVKELSEKWMANKGGPTADYERYSGKKLIRLGVLPEAPPLAYRDMLNNIIGLDIELMELICRNLEYRLEVTGMGMDQLFDALQVGTIDVMAGSIAITTEREQLGVFTIPYYSGGVVAAVLADQY